jgi:hypothetical protein
MATSTDGEGWTKVTVSTFEYPGFTTVSVIYAIAYGNNKFVAGGTFGQIATSTDGANWTKVTDSTFDSMGVDINAIAYGNNTFVAGGRDSKPEGSSCKMWYLSDN